MLHLLDVVLLEPVTSMGFEHFVHPSVCALQPSPTSGTRYLSRRCGWEAGGRRRGSARACSPLESLTGLRCRAHKRSQPQQPSPIPQLSSPTTPKSCCSLHQTETFEHRGRHATEKPPCNAYMAQESLESDRIDRAPLTLERP